MSLSKREILSELFSKVEALLIEEKVALSKEELEEAKKEMGVSLERLVVMVEKFLLAPWRDGKLADYLSSEASTCTALARGLKSKNPRLLQLKERVLKRELEKDKAFLEKLVYLLDRVCRVVSF